MQNWRNRLLKKCFDLETGAQWHPTSSTGYLLKQPTRFSCQSVFDVLSPTTFREIVSRRRRGLIASLWRALFRVIEVPYTLVVRLRNRRYDKGRATIHRVNVPVVSVGNLTMGGTGKTPLVTWLARWFLAHDVRVALISRGYGAKPGEMNDEALEIQQKLPNVPHIQNADRVAAAKMALEKHKCQLVLLDDAFQHRRIGRDLDIVLLDATEPFGHDHVFPRGTLREPVGGLRRADVIVLSRSDMISPSARRDIRQQAARLAPLAAWAEIRHVPRALISSSGETKNLDKLAGRRVAAFCGIGNPEGFRHTLKSLGYDVVAMRPLADHYRFDQADISSLTQWAATTGAEAIVCTCKDLVKIGLEQLGEIPLWAVSIDLEFDTGQKALEEKLLPLVGGEKN